MKPIYFIGVCIIFLSCNKPDTIRYQLPLAPNPAIVIPKTAINNFVDDQLKAHKYFDWKMASDTMTWSALVQADSVLSIGYQPAGFTGLDKKIHAVDVKSSAWKDARAAIVALVKANEQSDIVQIIFKEGVLPVIHLKVGRFATLKALRSSPLVRYAEPTGYGAYMKEASPNALQSSSSGSLSSGCGNNVPRTDLVANVDYTNITPAAKASWHYDFHHISQAWLQSSGQNVKVMLIDTGVSDAQENLGTAFNQGLSSGRSIEKLVTFSGATVNDNCGHGTSMAGTIAAPRGIDGNASGIAYNSNLVVVHAADNVVLLSSSAIDGVANAYILGADDPAVKIISMSMGTLFSAGEISDALNYASNKQKLMFCAAGTSTSFTASFLGVIFPANQPQVIAVTGMKDNLTQRCSDCHVGDKVDFAIVMEKTSSGRNGVTTAMSGDVPATVGGTSVATASCAAIAALVWSKYPSYPKDSIVARMRRSSSLAYNRSSSFGWGIVNAQTAVGL